jgi:hypothetical protein
MALVRPGKRALLLVVALLHLPFFASPPAPSSPARFRWLDAPAAARADATLTFVTVPKPQTAPDQIEMAKTVLAAWLAYPFARVLMLANASEYDPTGAIVPDARARFGARLAFGGRLSAGYGGRPLVRDWFAEGLRLVPAGFVCFVNGDVIVTPLWMNAAIAAFEALGRGARASALIYGTRTDVHRRPGVLAVARERADFLPALAASLAANARYDNARGMDAALVHATFDALRWAEIPDFVVGMCVWDNFFMGYANVRAATVTMDFGPKVFHVDHAANACNDENIDHFRRVAYRSPHFSGFHEHGDAVWKLRLGDRTLQHSWGGGALRLRRPVNSSIPAWFA